MAQKLARTQLGGVWLHRRGTAEGCISGVAVDERVSWGPPHTATREGGRHADSSSVLLGPGDPG